MVAPNLKDGCICRLNKVSMSPYKSDVLVKILGRRQHAWPRYERASTENVEDISIILLASTQIPPQFISVSITWAIDVDLDVEEVTPQELPLYIGWPWISDKFAEYIKEGVPYDEVL